MEPLVPSQSQKIQKLPPTIAERIAAGEVIERPSSVVKELVENSLDAGATSIRVVLEDGGKSLIEVTDNGSGMSPADLSLCIERHATSKLKSLEDLDHILTLGFRGEALPSIAAVSEVSITSRTSGSDFTFELTAGDLADRLKKTPLPEKITFGHFLHSPHGTRIQARGLFSQIPARLKFLKSQGTEVAQVREWLERLSLAYPHVGFELLSGERRVLNLKPQTQEERVRELLADGEDYPLLSVTNEQDGFRDTGLKMKLYWVQGLSSPQNRRLIQVVNSRAIRDKMLQQAMLSPFRQALLPGQFPALALIMEINPAAIDVNVHPTKAEIRFLDGRKIYQTLESMVRSLLSKNGAPAITPPRLNAYSSFKSSLFTPEHSTFSTEFQKETPAPALQESISHEATHDSKASSLLSSSYSAESYPSFSPSQLLPGSVLPTHSSPDHRSLHAASPLYQALESPLKYSEGVSPSSLIGSTPREHTHQEMTPLSFDLPLRSQLKATHYLSSARMLGTLFQTYILFELGNELVLVDQHAADERIRYEKLRKRVLSQSSLQERSSSLSSQSLLIPETVRFSPEHRARVDSRLSLLEKLGFEAEIFGEETLLFRAVPLEWGKKSLNIRLKNLLERLIHLESQENLLLDETLFESLASEACHSSVRAGDSLHVLEAQALVDHLFECEHPWNCPHGRPTVVKIPEGKVEEWFQRKL